MNKRYLNILTKFNPVAFPFMVLLGYGFTFIETYSYLGFLSKYILVDSRFFLVLAIVSAFLLVGRKINLTSSLILKINNIFLPLFTILYIVMQTLEVLHFRNYTFSKYHLQPANFFYIVIFSFILFIVSRLIKEGKFIYELSIVRVIIFFVVAYAFLVGLADTLNEAIYTDTYILLHANASYDFKMRERWGIYYSYIKFVKENTPESALILVPPQTSPWGETGNIALDRYFLYPRTLANGRLDNYTNMSDYDYVMISWGEEEGFDKDKYGWPKYPVNAEYIIYFDGDTGSKTIVKENYNPEISKAQGGWGIIKVKK